MLHKNLHCLWQIIFALVCTYNVQAQKAVHFGGDFMLGSSLHLTDAKSSFANFKQQPRFFAGFNNNFGWIYYDLVYEWEEAQRTVPLKYGITHHYEMVSHNLYTNFGLGPQQKYWHFMVLGGLGGNAFGGQLRSYNKFPDGTISYGLETEDNGLYINNQTFYLQYGAEIGVHFGKKNQAGVPRWRVNLRALNRGCVDGKCGEYRDRTASDLNVDLRPIGIAALDNESIGINPGWTGWVVGLHASYRLFDLEVFEINNNH